MSGTTLATIKWDGADWTAIDRGELPANGPATGEWEVGDVEAGFADADLILDETMFHQSMSHQPLETRSAMAYWQNGKCYLHASTQSTARTLGPAARLIGVEPEDVVLIAEYCGGGFGSKALGSVQMAIPALLSRKAGQPVMMRITRQEEHFIGAPGPASRAASRSATAVTDALPPSTCSWYRTAGRTAGRETTCRRRSTPR